MFVCTQSRKFQCRQATERDILRHFYTGSKQNIWDIRAMCIFQKSDALYSDKFFQNFKIGAHTWNKFFWVHFL